MSKFRETAELVGIAAIVASLIFVGLELQQSREIAVADVYQQQASLLVEIHNNQLATEPFMTAIRKASLGEELDETDATYLRVNFGSWLSYFENAHFQYGQGLLSEEHWRSIRYDIANRMQYPILRDEWISVRDTYRESFAAEIDKLIKSAEADSS